MQDSWRCFWDSCLHSSRGESVELSELTAYAEEKYHIREEFKWTDYPGFSVLREPVAGKWVALLMRQWDSDIGMQIELCDLKCGEEALATELFAPYLSAPFRMRGSKWIGIHFDKRTNAEVVFHLFDKAMQAGTQLLFTFAMGEETPSTTVFNETPLPSPANYPQSAGGTVPAKIREMIRIYTINRNNSFSLKCKNFYLQGKCMEFYEDNCPFDNEFWRFLPTYHDLNLKQLRGYFTWRTLLRRGEFRRSATPFAYLYIYELLNGIGVASPEEAFQKLEEFKCGYLDSGVCGDLVVNNLQRWMFDFAVIYNLPVESALKYAQSDMIAMDKAVAILRTSGTSTDEDILSALSVFASKTTSSSPVLNGDKGKHLFAETWRYAASQFSEGGKDLFTLCFGTPKYTTWHPLSNAVYWERRKQVDMDYALNEHHRISCRNGMWQEMKYSPLGFDLDRIKAFLHETDRELRKYLKMGSPLRKKPEEAWISPLVEAVIEADKKAEIEAAKPQITIDLSGLAQIRQDALLTQNSLLTEEEKQDKTDEAPQGRVERAQGEAPLGCVERAQGKAPQGRVERTQGEAPLGRVERVQGEAPLGRTSCALSELQQLLLRGLLQGESPKELLKTHHLMPSVVTDAINEAIFDEIGDNALECEDDTISIVEDYREDITKILGGITK